MGKKRINVIVCQFTSMCEDAFIKCNSCKNNALAHKIKKNGSYFEPIEEDE